MKKAAAISLLQWSTAGVCGIGAAQLVVDLLRHGSYRLHLPLTVVTIIAVAEIASALLFVIPGTQRLGGRCLLAVLLLAAIVHVAHGQYGIGNLVVYAAAVGVVLTHKNL